jgi:hypothetical protein
MWTSRIGRTSEESTEHEDRESLIRLPFGLMIGSGLAATSDPVKIGFVDMEQVLATVERGKAAREELERKGREAQQRLAPMVEQLQAMEKELQSKQFVMSEEAVKTKQLDMVELKNKYENKAKEEGPVQIEQQRIPRPPDRSSRPDQGRRSREWILRDPADGHAGARVSTRVPRRDRSRDQDLQRKGLGLPDVHPTAHIEDGASLAADVVVGAFSFVGRDVGARAGVRSRST